MYTADHSGDSDTRASDLNGHASRMAGDHFGPSGREGENVDSPKTIQGGCRALWPKMLRDGRRQGAPLPPVFFKQMPGHGQNHNILRRGHIRGAYPVSGSTNGEVGREIQPNSRVRAQDQVRRQVRCDTNMKCPLVRRRRNSRFYSIRFLHGGRCPQTFVKPNRGHTSVAWPAQRGVSREARQPDWREKCCPTIIAAAKCSAKGC